MIPFSLNIRGELREFAGAAVMAILNATPDSFYSRGAGAEEARRALGEGADILDLGACSTRPGAEEISADEEWARLRPLLLTVRELNPDIPVSVDTFRASVAARALAEGADIVNDVTGASADPDMLPLLAESGAPAILMHMRGTPQTMAAETDYPEGVTAAVLSFLAERLTAARAAGVKDIILDPGFGFAKTIEQNYQLLNELPLLVDTLKCPILVGLSRKSMFYRPLGLGPADVLPATVAANFAALERGAAVLRVHDVAAARQAVAVFNALNHCPTQNVIEMYLKK